MRKLLFSVPALLLLASCATVNIHSQKLSQDTNTYKSFLVLQTTAEDIFYEWNEENYQYILFGRFNDLDHDQDRKMLANSLKRFMHPIQLRFANEFFPIHRPIPYEDFMETVEKLDHEGILLVHTREKWVDEEYTDSGRITRPNSEYHVFILDREKMDMVWLGKSRASGAMVNDFQDLYNAFSRELAKDLHLNGLIQKTRPIY